MRVSVMIPFVENLDSEGLLQTFLISAVFAVLGIRFYLHITDYPQIGGGGLHIAHMLWGGLFMVIALVLLLNYLNNHVRFIAALLGGIGFGTFIDELGKFITHDNNYFFQPTVALIYVIFILLYLLIEALEKYGRLSSQDYMVNALEVIQEGILEDLSPEQRSKALVYLQNASNNDITKTIKKLLDLVKVEQQKNPSFYTRVRLFILSYYKKLVGKQLFQRIIITFFIVQAVVTILLSLVLTFEAVAQFFPSLSISNTYHLTVVELGDVVFSVVSGVFVIAGVVVIRKSRLQALKRFKISLLITLLLTQFFLFYEIQFAGIYSFVFILFIFIVVNSMIDQEQNLKPARVD